MDSEVILQILSHPYLHAGLLLVAGLTLYTRSIRPLIKDHQLSREKAAVERANVNSSLRALETKYQELSNQLEKLETNNSPGKLDILTLKIDDLRAGFFDFKKENRDSHRELYEEIRKINSRVSKLEGKQERKTGE